MSKPPWISYNKKLSCKWCFNLRQLPGEVECAVYHWRKICPEGYLFKPSRANTLYGEMVKKARKCPNYDGEVYMVPQKESCRK
jgi:hypothetical protein